MNYYIVYTLCKVKIDWNDNEMFVDKIYRNKCKNGCVDW